MVARSLPAVEAAVHIHPVEVEAVHILLDDEEAAAHTHPAEVEADRTLLGVEAVHILLA